MQFLGINEDGYIPRQVDVDLIRTMPVICNRVYLILKHILAILQLSSVIWCEH